MNFRAGDMIRCKSEGTIHLVKIFDGFYLHFWHYKYGNPLDYEMIEAATDNQYKETLHNCIEEGICIEKAIKQLQDIEKSYVGMHI